MPPSSTFAEAGDDLVEPDLAAELQRLLGEPLDQVLGEHLGEARDVEDVLLGIERHELAAQRRQRVHQAAGCPAHAGIEGAEQPGRAAADDRDVGEVSARGEYKRVSSEQ